MLGPSTSTSVRPVLMIVWSNYPRAAVDQYATDFCGKSAAQGFYVHRGWVGLESDRQPGQRSH